MGWRGGLAGGYWAPETFFKRSFHTISGFYVASDNDLSNLAAGNRFGGDRRSDTNDKIPLKTLLLVRRAVWSKSLVRRKPFRPYRVRRHCITTSLPGGIVLISYIWPLKDKINKVISKVRFMSSYMLACLGILSFNSVAVVSL